MSYILVDTKVENVLRIFYVVPGLLFKGEKLLDQFRYNDIPEYLEALELTVSRSQRWARKYSIDIAWDSDYDLNMSYQFERNKNV